MQKPRWATWTFAWGRRSIQSRGNKWGQGPCGGGPLGVFGKARSLYVWSSDQGQRGNEILIIQGRSHGNSIDFDSEWGGESVGFLQHLSDGIWLELFHMDYREASATKWGEKYWRLGFEWWCAGGDERLSSGFILKVEWGELDDGWDEWWERKRDHDDSKHLSLSIWVKKKAIY